MKHVDTILKHSDKILIGCLILAFALFAFIPREQNIQPRQLPFEQTAAQTSGRKKTPATQIMNKFVEAVEEMKRICQKNPKDRLAKLLIESDSLNSQIDTNSVICIGHCLEKDKKVGPLAQKISKRLHKNKKLLKKCFVDEDPESFEKFQRLLKSSTIKSAGLSCLWDQNTSQAAAFVAAAKCLEDYSQ